MYKTLSNLNEPLVNRVSRLMFNLSVDRNLCPVFVISIPVRVALFVSGSPTKRCRVPGNIKGNFTALYQKFATVLYHYSSCIFCCCCTTCTLCWFHNWAQYCVTDKGLINLPWFLAPFAPAWMFAVHLRNPQDLFPTRTPWMWQSYLGIPNWLWNVFLVCVFVFQIFVSGCNKEFPYLILTVASVFVIS